MKTTEIIVMMMMIIIITVNLKSAALCSPLEIFPQIKLRK
jgi:hypothetical protein